MEIRLAEACSGGDDRGIARRAAGSPRCSGTSSLAVEERHAVGHRFEIVEQRNARRIKVRARFAAS